MTVDREALEHVMVVDLSLEMHLKLARARGKGRGGWADPADCTVTHLWDCLREHTLKANLDMVDVTNLAGMVWWRLQNVPGDRELLSAHLSNLEQSQELELLRLRNGITHVQWSMIHDELFSGPETPRGRQVAWWCRELTDVLTPPTSETVPCTWCRGSGGDCDDSSKPCDECDGSGTKSRLVRHRPPDPAKELARLRAALTEVQAALLGTDPEINAIKEQAVTAYLGTPGYLRDPVDLLTNPTPGVPKALRLLEAALTPAQETQDA